MSERPQLPRPDKTGETTVTTSTEVEALILEEEDSDRAHMKIVRHETQQGEDITIIEETVIDGGETQCIRKTVKKDGEHLTICTDTS